MGEHRHRTYSDDLKIFLGGIVIFLAAVVAVVVAAHCGGPKPPPASPPTAPSPPPVTDPAKCDDGSQIGTVRDSGCSAGQTGQTTQVCAMTPGGKAPSWITVGTNCQAPQPSPPPGPGPQPPPPPPGCGKSVFADVQPTLQDFCSSCHATITTFTTASAWSAEISRRVALPFNDNDHMPQKSSAKQLCDPAQPTPCDKVALLQKWVSDGALQDCSKPPTPPTPPPQEAALTVEYLDGLMLADAVSLNQADRPFVRYLVTAGAINDGISGAGLKTWLDAINKGINSLNDAGQDLVPAKLLDKQGSVVRIDLRNYGIGAAEIAAIDAGDKLFNIVDNTSKGLVLQALIGDAKPWWDADIFLDTAFRNSAVYYAVLNVPPTLAAFQQQVGWNFQQDLATLPNIPGTDQSQVAFIGDIGQITLQKNRLIVRDIQPARSTAAYCYQTFDVNGVAHKVRINGQLIDTKILYQAPLLKGTGAGLGGIISSIINFTQDASETICQLPNGLQQYGLWDAAGNRLNAADPAVVIDTVAAGEGFSEVITAANTCSECHNHGIIPMGDTVLDHVLNTADQFQGNDVELVSTVYHGATADAALFAQDAKAFDQALGRLGITPGTDPQTVVGNRLRGNWTLSHAAAFLKLTPDQFKTALGQSPSSRTAIGALLTGGTVPFDTFAGTFQQLVKDAHLFQDKL